MPTHSKKHRHVVGRVAALMLFATLATRAVVATTFTTFMSVEPIPGGDVVGEPTLAVIESAGYENLELWSNRLLNDCGFVRSTIDALTADGAISTVNGGNTDVGVAAGGFEGTTHPSFVFTIRDSGFDPVSASDVDVLDNALGYVLNQEGTAHFSPDNFKAYAFALDYAVVTFPSALDGVDAKAFFEHLGTIDAALFSGQFAGFTQIAFQGSPLNNSMLFLSPRRRRIDSLRACRPRPARRRAPSTFRSSRMRNRRPPGPVSPFPGTTGLCSLVVKNICHGWELLRRAYWLTWLPCGRRISTQSPIWCRPSRAAGCRSISALNSGVRPGNDARHRPATLDPVRGTLMRGSGRL